MVRFGEPGWTKIDNERPINTRHSTLPPASVQISSDKQKRKATRKAATAATPRRHTRSMTTDAARKAVFDTPELLENIISFLPPRDILTKVQRLSRQWKTAVESSPAIRNKLWITSCKTPAIQSIGFTDEHIPGDPMWGQGARPMYNCALTLNSALFDILLRGKRSYAMQMGLRDQSLSSQNLDNNGGAWTFPTIFFFCYFNVDFQQTGAACASTWRRMSLTSPPITTVMLELHPGPLACHGPDDIYLHLTDHNGITLGLLHDTIFDSFKAHYGENVEFDDDTFDKNFMASLHFVCVSASLGTSILARE